MKTLAVVVTTPPNSPLTQTAYQTINSALNNNINVIGVFFYQLGVLNASQHLTVPNDEFPMQKQWCALSCDHNVPLYLCSTAAEKHGLINEKQPQDNQLIFSEFTVSGLGELVSLTMNADRVVQL